MDPRKHPPAGCAGAAGTAGPVARASGAAVSNPGRLGRGQRRALRIAGPADGRDTAEGSAGLGARRRPCAHAGGAGRSRRARPRPGYFRIAGKRPKIAPAATCCGRLNLALPSLAVLLYGGGVIDRSTRPEMGRIWSGESKSQTWLRVGLAVCEAYAGRGRIPADAMARIRARARVDIGRILPIQERVKHEMIALPTSLEGQLGEDSRF